jgi:hypothetical protein
MRGRSEAPQRSQRWPAAPPPPPPGAPTARRTGRGGGPARQCRRPALLSAPAGGRNNNHQASAISPDVPTTSNSYTDKCGTPGPFSNATPRSVKSPEAFTHGQAGMSPQPAPPHLWHGAAHGLKQHFPHGRHPSILLQLTQPGGHLLNPPLGHHPPAVGAANQASLVAPLSNAHMQLSGKQSASQPSHMASPAAEQAAAPEEVEVGT